MRYTASPFALLLCACVLALPACDSSGEEEEPPPPIAGEWSSSRDGSENADFQLTIDEPASEDQVGADLYIDGVGTGSGTGTFRRPEFEALIIFGDPEGDFETVSIETTLSDDGERLVGEIGEEMVTLYRQS